MMILYFFASYEEFYDELFVRYLCYPFVSYYSINKFNFYRS